MTPTSNTAGTGEHPDDIAVDKFAAAMKAKLARKRDEGRDGWDDPQECTVECLAEMLVQHTLKGDPIDVGNFAMMLWNRGCEVELLRAAKNYLNAGAELAALKASNAALVVVVEKLADWNHKYPTERIYSEGEIRSIAAEMDAINAEGLVALSRARGES